MKGIVGLVFLFLLIGLSFASAESIITGCPLRPIPACSPGTELRVDIGADGCDTNYRCVALNCPTMPVPMCIPESEIQTYIDENGCENYRCAPRGFPVSCPMDCVCNEDSMACLFNPNEGPSDPQEIIGSSNTTQAPGSPSNPPSEGPTIVIIGKTTIKAGNVESKTAQDVSYENNKVYAETAAGKKEIKIMPDTASERAIERLGELNFTIILKEVGQDTKLVYEMNATKEARVIGIFKVKAEVKARVDAQTGEIISVKRPWWAFLASGV